MVSLNDDLMIPFLTVLILVLFHLYLLLLLVVMNEAMRQFVSHGVFE